MLVISGLIAGYEDAGVVLEGIDLEVAAGESVALMGRNGMGKTTLLRAIMGHVRPLAGRVTFDGRDLTGRPPFVVSNAGIAYVPQGREIFTDFTVDENLLLGLLGLRVWPERIRSVGHAQLRPRVRCRLAPPEHRRPGCCRAPPRWRPRPPHATLAGCAACPGGA